MTDLRGIALLQLILTNEVRHRLVIAWIICPIPGKTVAINTDTGPDGLSVKDSKPGDGKCIYHFICENHSPERCLGHPLKPLNVEPVLVGNRLKPFSLTLTKIRADLQNTVSFRQLTQRRQRLNQAHRQRSASGPKFQNACLF